MRIRLTPKSALHLVHRQRGDSALWRDEAGPRARGVTRKSPRPAGPTSATPSAWPERWPQFVPTFARSRFSPGARLRPVGLRRFRQRSLVEPARPVDAWSTTVRQTPSQAMEAPMSMPRHRRCDRARRCPPAAPQNRPVGHDAGEHACLLCLARPRPKPSPWRKASPGAAVRAGKRQAVPRPRLHEGSPVILSARDPVRTAPHGRFG